MKTMAFVCLHYGSDYLGYAIRSVYDFVDRVLVLYAEKPSHGHAGGLTNYDTASKLMEAAFQFGDPENKIQWIVGQWANEGAHRNAALTYARKERAQAILVVDADEVWHPEAVEPTLKFAWDNSARICRARMIHFWRSFSHICTDAMTQERVILVDRSPGEFSYAPMDKPICHMGYARKPDDVKYKISIHGHKGEWRGDWFEKKFMAWPPPPDLHPTCVDTWNAQPYDKALLPEILKSHPYHDMEPIQ